MAKKSIIKLPTVINEDCWFYDANKDVLKDYIGMPYISYSSVNSWNDPTYREDFIKQKFGKIELDSGIYAEFGTFVGEAIENGEFGENPNNFQGLENLDLDALRPKGAQYERFVMIPFAGFIFIGFIDVLKDSKVRDVKTGGTKKEDHYSSNAYRQTTLYAKALDLEGVENVTTDVYFIRRTGSHVKPPLVISDEQFEILLEYNEEKAQEALEYVQKTVEEISECFKTFVKVFGVPK